MANSSHKCKCLILAHMHNLDFFTNFKEIAIMFSARFKEPAKSLYDQLALKFDCKEIILVPVADVICPFKCDKYESYFLVGTACPYHTFQNALQYKIPLEDEVLKRIENFTGRVLIDSIYDAKHSHGPDSHILVVSDIQMVVDHYSYKFESVCSANTLEVKSRVQYLMKESINGDKIKNKKVVGVVFTAREFEDLATELVKRITQYSSAYKIYLKDISYERLISIDSLDCIVLVDCPVFQYSFNMHIPVLYPFAVESALRSRWVDQEDRNSFGVGAAGDLVVHNNVAEIMEGRWFKGAVFSNEDEDMNVYLGKKGIASEYENEG